MATPDCDTGSDADSENAFPAALSDSQAKATGFAGGYLLWTRVIRDILPADVSL